MLTFRHNWQSVKIVIRSSLAWNFTFNYLDANNWWPLANLTTHCTIFTFNLACVELLHACMQFNSIQFNFPFNLAAPFNDNQQDCPTFACVFHFQCPNCICGGAHAAHDDVPNAHAMSVAAPAPALAPDIGRHPLALPRATAPPRLHASPPSIGATVG